MPRVPASPDATPEQNAARIVQNAALVFAERAERFASVCERHCEAMDEDARASTERWIRSWAERLIAATQPQDPGVGLNLLAPEPASDDGSGPMTPPAPDQGPQL